MTALHSFGLNYIFLSENELVLDSTTYTSGRTTCWLAWQQYFFLAGRLTCTHCKLSDFYLFIGVTYSTKPPSSDVLPIQLVFRPTSTSSDGFPT